jgi:MFS family permease
MSIFRSPAVALMPDVTVKPLRSKANAIINLMGTAGGILILVLGIVFSTGAVKNSMMNYTVYYGIVAALMLGALLVFRLTVREPQWAAEMRAESERLGIDEAETEENKGDRRLDKAEMRSLLLILASVALWYIGYNAITSKYSLYASRVLDMDYNTTLLLAQGAAIIAYIPAGIVASKIGRKKSIMGGVVMLTTAFAIASFLRAGSSVLVMNALFILAGIGWATINVNSFPMVVELSTGSDIGKYTGYYYTASMSAQIVTPVLSGALMDLTGKMTILFPYAAVFAGLAFATMAFVRHGDSRPDAQKGLEALNVDD